MLRERQPGLRPRRSRTIRRLLAIALLVGGAGRSLGQFPGKPKVDLPDATDAGSWEGTWYYVSRDSHIALWIRDQDGLPELRFKYMNTGRAESFITDWSGQASYRFDDKPGTFSFELTERDANMIRGKWFWQLGNGELRRTETAWVTMYRAGDGRALVMNFEDLERFAGVFIDNTVHYPQVWTLRKVSNNQRRWEELPF